jgi:hypothetical protein
MSALLTNQTVIGFDLPNGVDQNSIVTDRREDGACLGHRKPAVVAEVHWPESAFRHIGRPGRTGVSNG